MQLTSEERFAFIGYGNPKSNVWFVGSEEATECLCNDKNKNYEQNISLESSKANSTYGGYRKILEQVFHKKNEFDRTGQFFVTNLWPWGKKR